MSRFATDELESELEGVVGDDRPRGPVVGKSGFVPSAKKGFHGVPNASSEASKDAQVARSFPPLEYVGESKTDYVARHATPDELSWVEPPARMSIEELYYYLKDREVDVDW